MLGAGLSDGRGDPQTPIWKLPNLDQEHWRYRRCVERYSEQQRMPRHYRRQRRGEHYRRGGPYRRQRRRR